MRLIQKRKIEQAIDTMKEAHDLISEQCKQQVAENTYEMLVQLQEMAIKVGNIVEEQEDEPKDIISELERYCEQIYECGLKIDNYDLVLSGNREMKQQLEQIENRIKDIKAIIKIAFFPYKFSMWDCLESVYMAAEGDTDCEVQVIPIPYYTKGETDEFTELHYEGAMFERVCDIIDYKEYYAEEECPDIMYIHNPFDQYNKVTMVEPRFFSSELKKGGGILVYIPYYMSGGCVKYENMNIAYAKGAINSDYIILQSDALKEAYKFWGFPERRLLALGSPKVDAICKVMHSEPKVDNAWEMVIKGRKVILLNSSIVAFLNREDWLLSVKEMVTDILNESGLALIWRPHPLLEETVKTLGKEKEEQFKQLVTLIDRAENAIIDDSEDAAGAIRISDAMISDSSSLIYQYTFTEKPVLALLGSSKNRSYYVFCDFYSNYFVEDGFSVQQFVRMVLNGEDPKKEERMMYAKKSVSNTDGTCGLKVHMAIKEKY